MKSWFFSPSAKLMLLRIKICILLGLCIPALYFAGILDAEFGARKEKHGISIYFTPPPSVKSYAVACMFVATIFCVVFNVGPKNSTNTTMFRILGILIAAFFLVWPVFPGIQSEIQSNLPCLQEGRLTVKEFMSRYSCRSEEFIDRAEKMLSTCPLQPAINRTSMEAFLALSRRTNLLRSGLSRIQVHCDPAFINNPQIDARQIVNGRLYLTSMATHTSTQERTYAVVRDIVSVLRDCDLPDSDFLLFVEDGFSGNYWPLQTNDGDMYVPIFVQEMVSSAGIAHPVFSLSKSTNLYSHVWILRRKI